MALSLGRITVQSALGEPLRAEVEVPDLNAEEAASLRASVALPEAFRAAGLEYNPALASLQVTLQRRADGRAFIRLSGDRAINDPFVDLVLETRWASGRIVRDYTLLFDPPNLRQAAPTAPTSPQVATQMTTQPPVTRVAPPGLAASMPSGVTSVQAAEPGKIAAKNAVRTAVVKAPAGASKQVSVKPGDTASKIAAATRPDNVSLDQMLVALLRTNPAAFMGDNINRIKAGAIMNIPSAEQAGATPASEASRIIVAQSKDFNDFRRRLADNAPNTPVVAADRKASGTVQASVDDKKPATAAPDKLTLSKGSIQKLPTEDQLVKERSAKEAASRAAEISKNISDLSKLGAASSAVAAAPVASATASAQPGIATSIPNPVPAASATVAASPLASPASAVASAPVPVASAAVKRPSAVPVARPEVGLLDGLMENPLAPAGAVGLIALLAFFGLYRMRQRNKPSQVDSVFLENRLRPDSFFGASGGQSVDTNNGTATGSSMVYSPSQLDAVDDVDPVAEADVYLAYGRDLQAEEILKDALRTNPGRVAIHQKLLELYAKRRDIKSFEHIATLAFKATDGEGPDWERIRELGLNLDASNPLYLPGGQPNKPNGSPSRPIPLDSSFSQTDNAALRATQPSAFVDLDLDFSVDEVPTGAIQETSASAAETTPGKLDLDLDLDLGLATPVDKTAREKQDTTPAEVSALEFSLPEQATTRPDALPEPSSGNDRRPPEAPTTPGFDMLQFDLGSLSLDLGEAAEPDADSHPETQQDPLTTKLALAEEFRAIGDDDGARALIEEVIAEASGDMKLKAQSALGKL